MKMMKQTRLLHQVVDCLLSRQAHFANNFNSVQPLVTLIPCKAQLTLNPFNATLESRFFSTTSPASTDLPQVEKGAARPQTDDVVLGKGGRSSSSRSATPSATARIGGKKKLIKTATASKFTFGFGQAPLPVRAWQQQSSSLKHIKHGAMMASARFIGVWRGPVWQTAMLAWDVKLTPLLCLQAWSWT